MAPTVYAAVIVSFLTIAAPTIVWMNCNLTAPAPITPAPKFTTIIVSGVITADTIFYSSAVDKDGWEVVLSADEFERVETTIISTVEVDECEYRDFSVALGRKI
ncbi:MAG: hypothetical protein WCV72_01020 [Patescibacteria group bacterium]